jgi:hypothetical protein
MRGGRLTGKGIFSLRDVMGGENSEMEGRNNML